MNIQRFDPAYKAELEILKNKLSKVSGKDIQNSNLSHYEMGELRCAFEELVSWCINGENEHLTHCDCKNQQIQAIDWKLLVCYHYSWVNLCENKLPWPYQAKQPLIGLSGGL